MANYRIVCTNQEPTGAPHTAAHIVSVGTGDSSGYSRTWSVLQVYQAMNLGDGFYTLGQQTGKRARVRQWRCSCGRNTLKSEPDATYDNNLDSLPSCR
ncbi:MAG: DUF3892 domain-containing protein [Hyphomicrobiales bacterium]